MKYRKRLMDTYGFSEHVSNKIEEAYNILILAGFMISIDELVKVIDK
jgi:hypothetical protein